MNIRLTFVAALATSALCLALPSSAIAGSCVTSTIDWSWIGGPASVELATPICDIDSIAPGGSGGGSFFTWPSEPTTPTDPVDPPVDPVDPPPTEVPSTPVDTDPDNGGPTPTEGTYVFDVPASINLDTTQGVTQVAPGAYIVRGANVDANASALLGIPVGNYSGTVFNGKATIRQDVAAL